MPSSSAAVSGHGVATATVPSRDTAVEGFASSLRTQDEVDALCDKYGVPKDQYTARPAGDLRANSTPPPGSICVYARALEAGLRFPLHGFFREALAHFGIAPAQLTPNGWRVMEGFLAICHSAGVPPSLAVFLRFFYLSGIDRKHKKGWYCLGPIRDSSCLRFTGMPNRGSKSIMGWKYDFFFLSSPEPWHCAVEWGQPSKGSFTNPALTVEESKSMVKLLSAHIGAAVDLRNLLPATCPQRRRRRRLRNSYPAVSAAVITTGSPRTPAPPPPSSTRTTSCSIGMDPSVYDMMKVLLAEKAAAQASALAKKRTWEEANGGENVGHSPPLSVLSSVHSPPSQHFPSRHDGHTELLQGAVAQQLERAFAANEPSDDSAFRQVEEKLVAREREAAALREQLEEAKNELAAAKRAPDAEREKATSELAAVRTELETTKAELTAVEGEVVKTKAELSASLAEAVKTKAELAAARADAVKTKAELAAARAEAVKTKAELAAAREEVLKTNAELAATKRSMEAELVQANAVLTAAKRAAETELAKVKAKLAAVEAELDSAKAAAVQQLLASEEHVRQRAEDALEGYKRWRGRHAPAGRAA
ncbi:nuclease SbcCD subunit C-like [Triticum dicoccoides]|uniref:Transposase (putative) gypsy type domain-containing protein n=1 Tax=Triticum aestivum TaxID=4565 RepID=A0A3B6SDX8_WHEAT|nr:nuclease SbcCD subunit C-like [Triticum dicoccoides]XP_044433146.1 nuclease SbcCD subunit C-like [Triticum aestivum]